MSRFFVQIPGTEGLLSKIAMVENCNPVSHVRGLKQLRLLRIHCYVRKKGITLSESTAVKKRHHIQLDVLVVYSRKIEDFIVRRFPCA